MLPACECSQQTGAGPVSHKTTKKKERTTTHLSRRSGSIAQMLDAPNHRNDDGSAANNVHHSEHILPSVQKKKKGFVSFSFEINLLTCSSF
jgi:hypothetical protein